MSKTIIDLKNENVTIDGEKVDEISITENVEFSMQWEDGIIEDYVGEENYKKFEDGSLEHPYFSKKPVNGIVLENKLPDTNNEATYECSSPEWEGLKVLTVS